MNPLRCFPLVLTSLPLCILTLGHRQAVAHLAPGPSALPISPGQGVAASGSPLPTSPQLQSRPEVFSVPTLNSTLVSPDAPDPAAQPSLGADSAYEDLPTGQMAPHASNHTSGIERQPESHPDTQPALTTLQTLAVDPQELNQRVPGWDPARAAFDQAAPFQADAVVVGSGPGASVAVLRLAQAGKKVVVLERGRWFDYPAHPYGVGQRALWMPRKRVYGHNEFRFLARPVEIRVFGRKLRFTSRLFGRVIAWLGSGVGGGTHVWAKTLVRLAPSTIREIYPPEITPEAMQEHYFPVVEQMMGTTPYPDYAPYKDVPKTMAMQEMGRAMEAAVPGAKSFALPLAIRFAKPGQPMGQDIVTEFGTLRKTYDLGEVALLRGDWGTTNTTDSNYLAEALKTGNVKILALHQADRIEPLAQGYRIHAEDHSDRAESGRGPVRGVTFTARQLFLGAGTIGTAEILLRNKLIHRTLTALSPRLGERYGINGDRLGLAVAEKPTLPDRGPTNTWGVLFPDPDGNPEIFIIDGAYPHPVTAVLLTLLDAAGLRSPKIESGLVRLQRWIQQHLTRRISRVWPVPLLGMNRRYHAVGKLTLDSRGRIQTDVDLRANAGPDRAMDARMAQMAKGVAPRRGMFRAASRFFLGLAPWVYHTIQKAEAPHNMGGAPMGSGIQEGVVDSRGAVYGYEDLYLVDGSIHPPAMGMNPTEMIMATTERNMTHILFQDIQRLLVQSVLRILDPLPRQTSRRALLGEVTTRLQTERESWLGKRTTGALARPEGKRFLGILDQLQSQIAAGAELAPDLLEYFAGLSRGWTEALLRLTPQELEQSYDRPAD